MLVLGAVWSREGLYAALSLATGYTAAMLLTATLLVTPVYRVRRRRPAPVHLAIRRQLGVHAGLIAAIHVVVSFPVHLGGDIRLYFFEPEGGILITRFGLSNWVGLVAIVLLIALVVTSTNGWLRRLGSRSWKRLHQCVFVAAALIAAHTYGYQTVRDARSALLIVLIAAVLGLVVARFVGRAALRASDSSRAAGPGREA